MAARTPMNRRLCPVCRGTGLDPALNRRFTTGGRDDRRCSRRQGECFVDAAPGEQPTGSKDTTNEKSDTG